MLIVVFIVVVLTTPFLLGQSQEKGQEKSQDQSLEQEPAKVVILPVPAAPRPSAYPAWGPCPAASAIAASPTRPNFDLPASTTQCGMLEVDYGWAIQPMGNGSTQNLINGSFRYGVTPRLDLRWGSGSYIVQTGAAPTNGIGDQWFGARYRFHEQARITPAFAVMYNIKAPTASPAKGLGSGYVDHSFLFIASRDVKKYHFDFNTVGTMAGGAKGYDGGVQFGLALWRPVSAKLAFVVESYGGTQPATPDRFGAAVAGATYNVTSRLVLDAAYYRTYTAGSPRQQFTSGFTYTMGSPHQAIRAMR
ncbi:transporter [Paracidobacterium acidisoli]|uniref:Transporter n=1 Tax=Paracidobacterium acidisoli TaxID=2303751 RepID=A0A372IU02_9BACT|nr:transporter [Paracidobacterium acidisoli]MBT9329825.1 transporter [Paracidobacterium acidisoli]